MSNPFERGPERDPHEKSPCPECQGTGKKRDDKGNTKTCPRCGGSGLVFTKK